MSTIQDNATFRIYNRKVIRLGTQARCFVIPKAFLDHGLIKEGTSYTLVVEKEKKVNKNGAKTKKR